MSDTPQTNRTAFTYKGEMVTTRDRDGYTDELFSISTLLQLHDSGVAMAYERIGGFVQDEEIALTAQLVGHWNQDDEGKISLHLDRRTPAVEENLSNHVNAKDYYAPPGTRTISNLAGDHYSAAVSGEKLFVTSDSRSLTFTRLGDPSGALAVG